jgi:hypothetical protein
VFRVPECASEEGQSAGTQAYASAFRFKQIREWTLGIGFDPNVGAQLVLADHSAQLNAGKKVSTRRVEHEVGLVGDVLVFKEFAEPFGRRPVNNGTGVNPPGGAKNLFGPRWRVHMQ